MKLTPREREVLTAIRRGAVSMKAIACALDPPISPRTVEEYVYAIAEKLPDEGHPKKLLRVIMYACDTSPPP